MYSFKWNMESGGYLLTDQTGKFVANEIRPVFAPELVLTKLNQRFIFNLNEKRPLMWAKKNTYLIADQNEKNEPKKVAQLNDTQYGKPLSPQFLFEGKMKIHPIDIDSMVKTNKDKMDTIVADAKRRTKELYDESINKCDMAYIAFSGGKDSVVLLDICHRVLPLSVPVVFSDTDMELPDTYKVWEQVQNLYPGREYICARAESSALENWRLFGPPSRTLRWCCSVHKSTPALLRLKEKLGKTAIKTMAFVGVRSEESHSRSFYEDSSDGVKNASQINLMPILDWGAHELWLYIFANNLIVNEAYKKGISRVGCVLCPNSTPKHIRLMDNVHKGCVQPYANIIIETSRKVFKSEASRTDFIGSTKWQDRRSGAVLKENFSNLYEETAGLRIIFQSATFDKSIFFEWIKTLGVIVKEHESDVQRLKLPNTLSEGIPHAYEVLENGGGKVTFEFCDIREKWGIIDRIVQAVKKTTACVACGSCEVECAAGAISKKNGLIAINGDKCTKCHKCYNVEGSCWRFDSLKTPKKSNSKSVNINNYYTFGLRESEKYPMLSVLVDMGDDFFPWTEGSHPLGNKMVESARNWFLQAGLVCNNDKKLRTTLFLELVKKLGSVNALVWEFIWVGLANNADLIAWFASEVDFDIAYSVAQLEEMLGSSYPELGESTVDGGLKALRDMFTKSPLGLGGSVVELALKGRRIESITRKRKQVSQLTILYGLYVIAHKTNKRSNFSVRELLTADIDSPYVSPIVAFGILPDTFKKQCEGLRTRYPKYIETTFTHGNDMITVHPSTFSIDDIISLVMEV